MNLADNHVHNILRLLDGWGNFLSPQVKQSVIISNKLAYTSCLMICWTTSDLASKEIRKCQENIETS